jgi:hypothetical protein
VSVVKGILLLVLMELHDQRRQALMGLRLNCHNHSLLEDTVSVGVQARHCAIVVRISTMTLAN